ncbi:hypothetical protein [Bifidobacterium dentium]|uniref:hypothetical protein n=1 Tax=Bifidobacterium dentium TaxID=1689 RepID=UPI001FD757DF|nr:hypothetical protein [Bifidobacterium dentium]
MSEDKKAMRRLRIIKWALVTILILCLADIGGCVILSMVGQDQSRLAQRLCERGIPTDLAIPHAIHMADR